MKITLKIIFGLFVLFSIGLITPARAADTLCPDIAEEKSNTPGDVAGVQADIERLNLCVSRARLLKQLDQLALDRAVVLSKVNDAQKGDTMPGATDTGGIPPMPASALPSLPATPGVTPLAGEVKLPGNVRAKLAAANPLDTPAEALATWRVRKIWGQGTGMRAQVTDGGTLLTVVKGDPLPDGKVVETVSVRGVTISQNGKISDLSWDDTVSTGNTANAAQATP